MNKQVPAVRFDGFSGPWEKSRLAGLTTHRSGTAIEKYFSKSGKYKVISIGSYGLDSVYVDQGIRAIKNEITDNRLVKENELTMVLNDKTANGTIIGRCLLIDIDNQFVINQRTEIISPKDNFNSKFAYVLLNGPFRDKVKKIVQGGTQIYVNYSAVENLKTCVPSIEEQQKIGLFFKQLDELIALQQQELDTLKQTKQGFLQKMFPKEGETVPEVRFEGFSGKWDEKKLGEIATLASSKRIHLSDYVEKGIPFYRGSEISSGAITGQQELFISENLYQEIKSKYGVPKENDILVTAVGTLGNLWKIDTRDFYYKDGNLIQIGNISQNSDYIYSYLNDGSGKKKLLDSSAGSNQKALTMVKMREVRIPLPKVQEQSKIGSFFKQIDDTIALHQQELEALKETKQAFLQKMFV
ncbi:restriction endonuclease subunit S [Brochothrix thermosphacta]|uniref:restriction endonuclease subunit S n=1 Tax=Brochothrix thermosphacta TaxID=2756 RepID=UPI0009C17566|nr:restriction endonuclease subunit S [Brochothrix thermosphacta]SPN71786.1 putative restriction endonuclease subunit S [Brochothrix thermosphacta]